MASERAAAGRRAALSVPPCQALLAAGGWFSAPLRLLHLRAAGAGRSGAHHLDRDDLEGVARAGVAGANLIALLDVRQGRLLAVLRDLRAVADLQLLVRVGQLELLGRLVELLDRAGELLAAHRGARARLAGGRAGCGTHARVVRGLGLAARRALRVRQRR